MRHITYEKLRKRIVEDLDTKIKEFRKTIGEISENFRKLEFETAVWYPEKIHSTNLGGIDADVYIGYSRVEGRWGLILRTIEHDHESHAFVSQRVSRIESCGNIEIVINALKKVPDLVSQIHENMDHQVKILSRGNEGIIKLSNPDCEF